jgi:hypothetical protein
LYKTFKDKNFELKETTLKHTKMEEPLQHYTPFVSKKLKAKDLSKESIIELINTKDITLDENYNFNKHALPHNFRLINHLLFDFLINKSKGKKVILLKDNNEKINRDSMKTVEQLAENYTDVDFYYMNNSEENVKLLRDRFNLEFKNYPQLLILDTDTNDIQIVPQIDYLTLAHERRNLNII